MATIGFIFTCVLSLYFILGGVFVVFADSTFGGSISRTGVFGMFCVALGFLLGYYAITNAPFTILMH